MLRRSTQPMVVLLVALALPGCTTVQQDNARWWNPLTWGSSRPAAAAEASRSLVATTEDATIVRAQETALQALVALEAAPPSRPVEIATESARDTTELLAVAAGPLPPAQTMEVRTLVAGLLSEETAKRRAAEREWAAARANAAELAADLAAARAQSAAAALKLEEAFHSRNALANELHNVRLQKYGAAAGALALGALAWYLRTSYGSLAKGVAGALTDLRRGNRLPMPELEQVITALDVNLTPSAQRTIASLRANM